MEEHNLLVVSDLHLCEGLDPATGRFSRLEDFLFDAAFARFLRYHQAVRSQPRFGDRPWLLVFDGDLFDFLQVVSLPAEGRELYAVKGVTQVAQLPGDERKHGLGTTERESVWKIKRIARGHQPFFAALGRFIAHGNHVAVVKGNHDVELHWPGVWQRFVLEIKRAYSRERLSLGDGPPVTLQEIRERMHFYPWFYHEPGRVYVEHGGQYESSSHFPDLTNPLCPDDPTRIRMPWGNLFLRYLFNQVEDVHPFADNVKPPVRYLAWALQKDPLMTARLLVTRGWIFVRTFWHVGREISRKQRAGQDRPTASLPLPPQVAGRIGALARRWVTNSWREWLGLALRGVPSLVVVAGLLLGVWSLVQGSWWRAGACLLAAAGAAWLGQALRRNVHTFDDFVLRVGRDLERILWPDHPVRYVVMGHDHQARIERLEHAWYVNTGTWVQVFEKQGPIQGRDKLTFFRLSRDHTGAPELLRWDDAAGAPARLRFGLDE